MIDKELFRLLGGNKKYIFMAVAAMVVGLIANVGVTACICLAVHLLIASAHFVPRSWNRSRREASSR